MIDKSGIDWAKIRYFKPEEFLSPDSEELIIDSDLVVRLDEIRRRMGKPIIITSGYRTVEHNAKIGGKSDSAHLTGNAVDIKCDDDNSRHDLLKLMLSYSSRIGIAKNFIHFDNSKKHKQEVIWLYA